jgi:hypothetical protein
MGMQRQAGSAPKPRAVTAPPVAPSIDTDAAPHDGTIRDEKPEALHSAGTAGH